jgi:hypothetical protein
MLYLIHNNYEAVEETKYKNIIVLSSDFCWFPFMIIGNIEMVINVLDILHPIPQKLQSCHDNSSKVLKINEIFSVLSVVDVILTKVE